MAESSRRFRKSTSRSIAASSAIALALGGISIVGPGPLAPHAAADTLSGGIRDKAGAVEKGAQQPSDLPAGSCTVSVDGDDAKSGSQAGFTWNTLEPNAQSPDKTLWGLSLAFDNSQDRTFADWGFSNTGKLKDVLDTGQVPSMEADQTFLGKSVTHKAGENINITANGRIQRNLNFYAELTDEKVKQFASASADNPVRYAWQSNYKKDNPEGPYATQGDAATFSATVNPWPSENNECNPVTVSWEESQRFVVNPGNENKVGHINVPALSKEGVDDSLSRMVVEAYDEDGNLIGTSDTEASGGEQNLRIDGNGDIFFTWPEYVDSDHATDKNVNFSVLAKPRTTEQLQSAAEHNSGYGVAFESSNSLDRYSKANVVGSGGVALDNTDLHNPEYDENEKHITSEIGEDADERRHVVTFTPVVDAEGNTLQDLVEKFNATVELDEDASNIYENWDAELNADYTVTVKSPGGKDTRPGTFAQPMVKVTYSNGSTDLIPLLVIVDPNNTQTTDVNYPKTNSGGAAGKPMTSSGTPTRILGKGNPVTPATYAIKNAPAGWDVTVDDDGTITAIPPADAKPGDFATVDLTVTYPDGTIDTPSTTFVVGERKNKDDADPTFPEKTVYPDEETTSPLTVEKPDDLEFAETDPFVIDPEAEEFAPTGELNDFGNPIYKFETENGDWFVSLDDNGDVISKIPATAQPGDQVNVPIKVTYADGSYDMANAPIVVVDNKREVPFETVYVFNPAIPAGEYEVREKGVPGEEVLLRDETWNRTKDPINEVVYIGTKPPEASEDVKWTVPIPFPTEVRENLDLAPGETKVVQEGENGEKTYTAKFTAKGSEANVAEQETTKEPKPRIIEVGPGIDDQELTSTKTQEVPFEIEYVYDDTLEPGEQVVEEEGVPGEETITSTQKIVDGKPSGEPSITIEQTKAPKNAKIRVGTKTTGENTETVESEIPFGVKVEFDPTMPAGTSETVTEGKPGKKTVTIERDITNSTPGEPNITEEVVEEPVDQVIKVGTKPSEASEKVEWKAQVPFEVETRPNPELKPGEIKVAQQGVPGEKTYSANFSANGDQATVDPEEKQTKAPINEIIEYGPAPEDTSVVTKVEKPVPFETEIVFDETLPAGEQVVDQQGEKGEELITSTQGIKDGKPSGEPTISTEETKAPKKAIIRVGTKQVDPDEPAPAPSPSVEPLTIPVAYPVKYEFDPNLPAGEEVVDQEGTPGSKTLRPKLEMVDGKPVWTIEEVETQKPVQRIVRVGTKQAETNPFTWTSEVPFNTTVKPNPELAPGESRVVQVGENGSTKYSADPATGEVTKLEEKKPVERIVEYGPKDDVAVTKVTRPVPFETEVIYDPDLPEGAQRIEQGEVGEEVVTTTQDFKDGQLVGEPTTNTERTREPKNAVVRIGTKKTPKNASVTELEVPPTTQLIFDPSLEPGEQVVVREGTPGTVRVTTVDDETTVENTLDAIPRLVRVGAKQPDQLNWLEPLPFKVIATENPDLPAGEHKVIQEGKPGLVQHVGDTATTVTEPQDYLLEIGTAKDVQEKREVITEPIPFETIFIEDDTLAAGVVKVDTHGENGAKRTTKVWEMKEGKELGDPTVTDETLREPTNLVIRVGTGKPVEEKPEDPKPEQPKPDTPVEDEKGSSAERCVANAFAANSPLLWLLPVGLLGAIGYGVNEMYGPQINQAAGALNARWEAFVRENTPDFGHGHRGIEKPEWVRQAEAQANALNQQFNQRFAGYGEQLRPVGIALGALAAVALTGTLIAQACSEEGFDNGMTVLGSTERKLDFGASSEKTDGAKAGSSSREAGSSKKNALTTAAKPTGEK